MGHLICSLVLFITFFILIWDVFRKLEDLEGADYLLFALLFLLLWLSAYNFYYYEPRPNMAIFWYSITIFSKSMVFVSLWIFAIKWTNPFFKIRNQIYFAFYAIPIITMIFVLANSTAGLYFSNIAITQIHPEKILEYKRGIWFYVDYVYNIVALIVPIVILLKHYKSISVVLQFQYIIYAFAYGITLIFQIFGIFGKLRDFDVYLIGTSIGFFIIYWNLFHYRRSDVLFLAKDSIFEKITCACLVLEIDGKILDSNPEAKKMFSDMSKPLEDSSYDDIKDYLVKYKDATFEKNDAGEILQIYKDDKAIYFQILTSEIMNKNTEKIGDFVEIRDVTAQQELISELFKQANFDSLTKLHNRRYFDLMSEKIDKKENHPIGVISGDLNSLKYTNDTYGHKAGDEFIISVSKILKIAARGEGIIARTGGDEFLILFSNANDKKVKEYINRVEALSKRTYQEPFGNPSISLGYAIKETEEETMEEALKRADFAMYEHKREFQKRHKHSLTTDSKIG